MQDLYSGLDTIHFLTINETARLTNLSAWHIRNMIRDGEIDAIYSGSKALIPFELMVDRFKKKFNASGV